MSVYVISTAMLFGDDQSDVSVHLISDPSATHYWDGKRLLGIWFAQQEKYKSETTGPIACDTYFLYGPTARRETIPEPLVTFGRTVIGKSKNIENNLNRLLTAD